MKIERIYIKKIKHRPLMEGVDISFEPNHVDCVNSNCFIGTNGSGKSQLLETIAEIFLYVDQFFRKTNRSAVDVAPLLFVIEYSIYFDGLLFKVKITQDQPKGKTPIVEVFDENESQIDLTTDDIEKYLPEKIIGYSSGENETISVPFYSYYDSYADYVAHSALKDNNKDDYEPRFYFMDYNTNLGIAISNLIFDTDEKNKDLSLGLTQIKKELNIKKIKNFQVIIQTKQSAAPKLGVLLTKELKEWLQFLKKSSTCYNYSQKENKYTFDFYNNQATKDALKFFFKTSYKLYTALYKFEILNNLIVDRKTRRDIVKQRQERKLNTKMPTVPDKDKVLCYSELKLELTNNQIVDYLSLSDGEHQYFNVFGTILMVDQKNSLFLLDEPETHFNPKWRRLFIDSLNGITKGRSQDLFLTSHSPFIVSDTPKEFVYIFKRVSSNKIEIDFPKQETYGASFNHILKTAFELDENISEASVQFIMELLKSNDIEEIKKGISILGDSPKLMSLYRRLDMLEQND